LLQPFGGVQIQMIGRLVHQQQVGLLQDQPGQQAARPLPAAEMGQRHVVLGRGEAQSGEHLAHAQLPLVAAGGLERRLARAIVGQRGLVVSGIGHALLQMVQRLGLAAQLLELRGHVVPQRRIAHGGRVLRQIADGEALHARHHAVVGRVQVGQDAQQGGLALAVGADQADAIALLDAQIDPLEHVQRAEASGQIAADDD